ncbi:MAG: glycosyltransferase family 4 protein [Lachnospiraceae bacterium]|nr:glycosyltransferase family 4 protein [Lachnospiraceae bacterium]
MNWAILELYCGNSGKLGYYNSQELGLARALAQKGINVSIIYPINRQKRMDIQEIEERIVILRVPSFNLGVHSFYNLKFLLERKIEVVQLNSDNQIYAPMVMKFCQKNGILLYNYVGTVYSDSKNAIKKQIMKLISIRNLRYYRKSIVLAKTNAVKKSLGDKRVDNVQIVPVGLDITNINTECSAKKDLKKELGIPENKKVLLFVGRLEHYKRPFAALELLNRLGQDYCLVVIGSGNLKMEFCAKIQSDFKSGRVFYYERIPNSEMYRFYRICDYFVNFNIQEIFGMSILEAMYQKCIVIARRAPGPNEIIENGISGFLCDNDEQMVNIIKNRNENQIGEHAMERVVKCFTWNESADKILQIVNDRLRYKKAVLKV